MTRADRELDAEIENHLAEATEEYIARGLSPEEARFAAMRDFGGITQAKQVHREMRRLAWLDDAVQDIRFACRRLTQDRAATVIAMVTLAAGIGVSSALFSVIDATMLRPLPYQNPEELVEITIEQDEPDGRVGRPTASMDDLRLWQAADDVFTTVAGWGGAFRGRIVDGPQPQRLPVQEFTEDYLKLHGVTPLLGRDFVRDDCLPGSPVVALLGYGYWQSHYGGRLDVLGQSVRFEDGVATIVGVLPSWFDANKPLTLPLRIPENQWSRRGTGRLTAYGRLRPGVTVEQAREKLTARMPDRRLPDGRTTDVRAVVASRLDAATSGNRITINVLSGAVALILLIACVNVAALLLARGAAREPELAIRASLGAGRGRLVRQLLAESVVLALCGAALGVVLAWISLDALVANIPLRLPDNSPIAVNLAVLASTAALLIPTVLLFGLLPAIRLSRVRIPPMLARGRHLGSPLTRRGGQWLIATETALALVLLAGAGLMIRSFARITATDLGFEADRLITMQVLPLDRNVASHTDYYTRLLQQIRTIPGIASAGLVDNFALGGGTSYSSFVANGKKPTPSTQFKVMPGYLETIGARLRDGRFLAETDDPAGLRGVVINQSAARAMFGTLAAVGQTFSKIGDKEPPWTVVGVIEDIRHRGPIDPRSKGESQIFFPYQPDERDRIQAMTIVMRSTGGTPRLGEQLRAMALSAGPKALVENIRSSNELFGERVITPKRRTVLLTLLGVLGLALALVGIFGMTAYSVVRRTPEIGVRIAFGARAGQVVSTILRDAVVPIAFGTVAGLAASLLVTPVIKSFLFETTPAEPATLVSVAAILVIAGCLAAFASARRAASIDPAISLRAE